jgi:lipoprotein-anchoring transpeptidase ErfK/SrfK
VSIDLYEQVAIAYEDDQMIFATLISSGLPDWPTREGLYQVWERVESGGMSGAEGEPDFYSLESVPWTMYFDEDRSLHGTYWHDGFGYRHSHGCVNLSITDSAWFYEWASGGDLWVYVYSSGDYNDV